MTPMDTTAVSNDAPTHIYHRSPTQIEEDLLLLLPRANTSVDQLKTLIYEWINIYWYFLPPHGQERPVSARMQQAMEVFKAKRPADFQTLPGCELTAHQEGPMYRPEPMSTYSFGSFARPTLKRSGPNLERRIAIASVDSVIHEWRSQAVGHQQQRVSALFNVAVSQKLPCNQTSVSQLIERAFPDVTIWNCLVKDVENALEESGDWALYNMPGGLRLVRRFDERLDHETFKTCKSWSDVSIIFKSLLAKHQKYPE